MTPPFDGQVCLVTGAGTGIGAAVAELMAARGARVAVVGLPTDPLQDTVDRIRKDGGTALAATADVADAAQVQEAVDRTVAEFGGLDLAVNAAGIAGVESLLHEQSVEDWDRVLRVNLFGVFHSVRAEISAMIAGGRSGRIVNIASVQATNPLGRRAAYTSSKFGVIGLTKTVAKDYADRDIRVNAVSPGITDTPMLRAGGATADMIAGEVPMKRVAEPIEMAQAAAFLLSDEAAYITGQEVVVDGGFLLRP
ncbi:SDR family oxidoreductase [Pseudonocardia kujensis]|uniref:SDR family NAD(P)-dependent oxidoreductase n=1 Tax=Pseudonocardia kujensis TaxID=1128675 RepID=UPI001E508555|nr:SDR family NAD(P)-dependent oxidoreductase [Pseudonocardia kujensis]MCE0763498.1 SDR family oxidoreductase [Pseudonocardia kujensis]